uniref:Uncharacterized protein n=1 Tax=Amphiprion percula TaxID=161767 RepID=A0A3P8TV44_AMPPE
VMQASSPVDGNVCLLFVQLHSTSWSTVRRQELLAELKQTIKHWAVLSHINSTKLMSVITLTSLHLLAEFDVIITVILGHLLSTTICNFTYIYLHLSVEAIVEQQVVCHADPVGLHGMPLSIVIISNITCEEDKDKTKHRIISFFYPHNVNKAVQNLSKHGLLFCAEDNNALER